MENTEIISEYQVLGFIDDLIRFPKKMIKRKLRKTFSKGLKYIQNFSPISICMRYQLDDKRIKVVNKKNGGLSSARNSGLEVATGDYIGFIDGDDYIHTKMYEVLISLTAIYNTKMYSVDYKKVAVNENIDTTFEIDLSNVQVLKQSSSDFRKLLLMHVSDTSFCTKIFDGSFIKNYKFDEKVQNEDFILLFHMMSEDFDIISLKYPFYYYLTRPNSITTTKFGKNIVDMVNNARDTYFYCLKENILLKESERFYMYQMMAYLLLIPLNKMKSTNQHYLLVENEVKKYKKQIINNDLLRNKDKMILIIFIYTPKIFKFFLQFVNYRKAYR